jgi:hypothetical protein
LLVAATVMLTAGSGQLAQAGPDAAASRTETSPAPPPPIEIRPTDNSPSAPKRAPAPPPLSFWSAQIAKLARAGIEDDIILSFLDNAGTLNLGADQIIYLTEQGVSRGVITAMLQHDFEISSGLRPLPTFTAPMPQAIAGLSATDVSTGTAENSNLRPGVHSNETAPAIRPDLENPEPENISAGDLKNGPGVVFVEFPVWEYAVAPVTSADQSSSSRQSTSAPPKHTYAIREPYPVPITDPIIVIQSAVIEPNVVEVQSFP